MHNENVILILSTCRFRGSRHIWNPMGKKNTSGVYIGGFNNSDNLRSE